LLSSFQPDSAIDLIDEAASGVRVARDSLPEEVDSLNRAKLQLEIELHAIKGELAKNKKDEVAKQKIHDLESAIAAIDEQLAPIMVSHFPLVLG
jgi:ATP-dependent Clp protease ATP-binding subunit ClpB